MIDNIFEKGQIIQFFIILFMKEYSNKYKSNNNFNKDILINIEYNKKYIKNIFQDTLEIKDNNYINENNDYFYFFNSSILKVFFFKTKNSNEHNIFIDGLKKIKMLLIYLVI